jgi:hypothetical protein
MKMPAKSRSPVPVPPMAARPTTTVRQHLPAHCPVLTYLLQLQIRALVCHPLVAHTQFASRLLDGRGRRPSDGIWLGAVWDMVRATHVIVVGQGKAGSRESVADVGAVL